MTTPIDVQTEMFKANADALALRDSCKAANTHQSYKGPIKEWKGCPCPKKARVCTGQQTFLTGMVPQEGLCRRYNGP